MDREKEEEVATRMLRELESMRVAAKTMQAGVLREIDRYIRDLDEMHANQSSKLGLWENSDKFDEVEKRS